MPDLHSLKNFVRQKRFALVCIIFFLALVYKFEFSPPSSFPYRAIITLPPGNGLLQVSKQLQDEHVIRSTLWFRTVVILLGGEKGVQAGDYYFPEKETVWEVAYRLIHGKHGIQTVRITVPEGFTVKQISSLFDVRFPYFDHYFFETHAKEGYLFPDTYFIAVNANASTTLNFMEQNFEKKTRNLEIIVLASGHTMDQIVTMASLLEAEAKVPEDLKLISGILWKRISLGMPLQVDSSKGTYTYKGLPKVPIDNPGLIAIEAAIYPEDSPYLYYINDKQGQIHYAKTLDEQDANIKKYLR